MAPPSSPAPARKITMRTTASVGTVTGMIPSTCQNWFLKPRNAA